MLRVVDGCLGVETVGTHPKARPRLSTRRSILMIKVSHLGECFYNRFNIGIVVV